MALSALARYALRAGCVVNRTILWLAGIAVACVLGALAMAWPFLAAMHIGILEAIAAVLR